MATIRIGVEVGGTFTDLVVARDGRIVDVVKVLSTPGSPDEGVLNAVAAAATAPEDVAAIVHGSTVATNAVLERKGARTVFVTTEGFRDVVIIQRQSKLWLYDLFYHQPEPLVTRDRIVEVPERVLADGSVERSLDRERAAAVLAEALADESATSVAVGFLNSYASDENERALADLVAERWPDRFVTTSADVLPEFREYERFSTTLMAAYLKPVIHRYLTRLGRRLKERGFAGSLSIVQSNGGAIPADYATRNPARMILSGPAAGRIGAIHVASRALAADAGSANGAKPAAASLVTFDMGGTSTDICLVVDGKPRVSTETRIGGLPLKLPMVDIHTVGAGGGSVVWVDQGGLMRVGPQSAGADPGPACYGRGGSELTVTDCNLLLGVLRPENFFGGKLKLDVEAAGAALNRLAGRLNLEPAAVAAGARQVVNATMARGIRLVSTEKGFDPRDCTLVAFGGSGPLHAVELAAELGMPRVLFPTHPGLLSAYGLLMADAKQDYVQTRLAVARDMDLDGLRAAFAPLRERALADFTAYGYRPEDLRFEAALDMRFMGQAYELPVSVDDLLALTPRPSPAAAGEGRGGEGSPVGAELGARFERAHAERYGHCPPRQVPQIVNIRLGVVAPSAVAAELEPAVREQTGPVESTKGEIRITGRAERCRFYRRDTLPPGFEFDGPAVLEEGTATGYIPAGWHGQVDAHGNILVTRDTAPPLGTRRSALGTVLEVVDDD